MPSAVPGDPDLTNTMFAPNATFACKVNADCTAKMGGRCVIQQCGPGGPACLPQGTQCAYDACGTDFDCDSNNGVCECGTGAGGTNQCIKSQCRVDADCGSNGYCSPAQGICGFGTQGYFCHSTADQCLNDRDCNGQPGNQCLYDGTKWTCQIAACPAIAANGG
jgi:hypothetical protein